MKRMTWNEAVQYLTNFNKEHGIHTKEATDVPTVRMVAVISQESFKKEYSLESRSYSFTNINKAFLPDMGSKSIFASSLDLSDLGVRLDWYVYGKDPWIVEYCYIDEEDA